MDPNTTACPECGAVWKNGQTCQDSFYQMLYWEDERPAYGSVHHLMVLCYHLQHPSLYSPEGLKLGRTLLDDFLTHKQTPETVRRRMRDQVNAGRRDWKITSRPGLRGAYARAPQWEMTAVDVVARGVDQYRESVNAWALSVMNTLRGIEDV